MAARGATSRQDIANDEYELISALAGRTSPDADARLSLFAVGDDDQNIYAFNGSSVRFIRSFENDHNAKPTFLTDNYRSTGHIITAANAVIKPAQHRMKASHPIRINQDRGKDPVGGRWAELDLVALGKVQILPTADNSPISQTQAAVTELKRLSTLVPDWEWSACAVIARQWNYLEPVRAVCEHDIIPTQMANEGDLSVWHLRETQALVNWIRSRGPGLIRPADLNEWLNQQPSNPWNEMLQQAVEEHNADTEGAEVSTVSFIEWLAEWARDARRRQRGLLLLTAHRAKGLEFDHVVVLDGRWGHTGLNEDPDASRRLYYVAMTRARQTLALTRLGSSHPFQDALQNNPSVLLREPVTFPPPAPELARSYRQLTLSDVYLSFVGYKPPNNRVHRAIAALSPGDQLQAQRQADRWELRDSAGTVVGTLSRHFKAPDGMRCANASVAAVATWSRERSEPQYQQRLKNDTWEVVVPELVFEP